MRISVYEKAERLAALLALGGFDTLPLADGRLDRMIEGAAHDLSPLLGELSFSDTSVGRRCFELPDILLAGEECGLFETDGSTFTRTSVRMGRDDARCVAIGMGLSTEAATGIGEGLMRSGEALRAAVAP